MQLNIYEIFETAINIEKTGYTFYEEAAKAIPEHSEFLRFLANEEIGHEKVFLDLQNRYVSDEEKESIWNPDNVMGQYFYSLAESTIFSRKKESIKELFTKNMSIMEVIDWAIKREQESVLFFTGLRESLKGTGNTSKIESIISEEINHIHILMDKKSKLL